MYLKLILILILIQNTVCDKDVLQRIENVKEELVNPLCKRDILRLFKDFFSGQKWAVEMFDASAKRPSGLIEGNLHSLGNFDQCMAIKSPGPDVIEGKYCAGVLLPNLPAEVAAKIKIPKLTEERSSAGTIGVGASYGYWGLCRPHTCSGEEMTIMHFIVSNVSNFLYFFPESTCQTESTKPEFTTGDIWASVFLGFIGLLIVLSTTYDIYLYYSEKKSGHDILISFSFLTNSRKLFTTSTDPNQLHCLSGIRTISMMWVVLGHCYSFYIYFPIANINEIFDFYERPSSMYLFGATVSVDTFFLISGLLITYLYMKSRQMRLLDIPFYYIHRYLRLTPSLAVMLLLHVTLLEQMGSGPVWPVSKLMLIDFCKEWWYTTLLYVQNYVNPSEECIGQSWYLSVDFQLFLISPLILIPLKKFPKITLAAVGLCTAVSISICFYVAWEYHLCPLYMDVTPEQTTNFMQKYYVPTHTRANVWLIGIIFGYFIHLCKKKKTQIKLKKITVFILWAVSLTLLTVCVFVGYGLITDDNKVKNTLYITFIRPVWAIALCWLIFACIFGYGGPINAFLSLPIFQVMARLTYSMYIIHITLIMIVFGSIRSPLWFYEIRLTFYEFWAVFMTVLIIGIFWTLAFESPIIAIEKALKKKEKRQPHLDPAKNGSEILKEPISGNINSGYSDTEVLNNDGKENLKDVIKV